MTQRPIVRPEAELDIAEASFWYENERPGLGSELLAEIDYLFERIVENPLQFPEIERGVRRGLLRRFPYGVYFIAEAQAPTVLAVLHLRRHPDTWKSRG